MAISYSKMGSRAHRPTSLACSVVNSIKPCLKASEDQHTWLPLTLYLYYDTQIPIVTVKRTCILTCAHMF